MNFSISLLVETARSALSFIENIRIRRETFNAKCKSCWGGSFLSFSAAFKEIIDKFMTF
jgi:hypothetical protein